MSTAEFEHELQEIRDRYLDGCVQRIAEVQRLADAWLLAGQVEAGAKLVRALHRFAGSAGSFGFAEIGERARTAEDWVRGQSGRPESPNQAAIQRVLFELETEVERQAGLRLHPSPKSQPDVSTDATVSTRRSDRRPLIRFASSATEARFGCALREAGFRTETGSSGKAAPFAFVATEGELAAASTPELGHRIALLGTESFDDRLAAARAGARTVLVEPVEELALVEALEDLRGTTEARPPRVVVVDDDAEQARQVARILEIEGMEVEWVTEASRVLGVVRQTRPDVLLTDLHMPNCDGFDLAAIVRQDVGLISLPVVFMSADENEFLQRRAMRLDGDAFVLKSESLSVLTDVIRRKARRARQLETSMTTDSMTGLLRHSVFKERLENEIARARRADEPLSCAMVDLDHFKAINDRHGHATGDRVIQGLARLFRRRLRTTDLVGRYGGEEFCLALLQVPGDQALRVVDDLRDRFARLTFSAPSGPIRATLSAGISSYPAFEDRDALLLAADEALYGAKRGGRNRVVLHDHLSLRAATA